MYIDFWDMGQGVFSWLSLCPRSDLLHKFLYIERQSVLQLTELRLSLLFWWIFFGRFQPT
jgi:hypothetical protein